MYGMYVCIQCLLCNYQYFLVVIIQSEFNTFQIMYIVIVIWWNPFIPSRNLDGLFTYNHMALMSLRSRSHIKPSLVLMSADHLLIHNYIRSILNIILRPIIMVRPRLEPAPSARVSDALATEPHRQLYIL